MKILRNLFVVGVMLFWVGSAFSMELIKGLKEIRSQIYDIALYSRGSKQDLQEGEKKQKEAEKLINIIVRGGGRKQKKEAEDLFRDIKLHLENIEKKAKKRVADKIRNKFFYDIVGDLKNLIYEKRFLEGSVEENKREKIKKLNEKFAGLVSKSYELIEQANFLKEEARTFSDVEIKEMEKTLDDLMKKFETKPLEVRAKEQARLFERAESTKELYKVWQTVLKWLASETDDENLIEKVQQDILLPVFIEKNKKLFEKKKQPNKKEGAK